jgi:hypothetical protein
MKTSKCEYVVEFEVRCEEEEKMQTEKVYVVTMFTSLTTSVTR